GPAVYVRAQVLRPSAPRRSCAKPAATAAARRSLIGILQGRVSSDLDEPDPGLPRLEQFQRRKGLQYFVSRRGGVRLLGMQRHIREATGNVSLDRERPAVNVADREPGRFRPAIAAAGVRDV